MAFSLDELKKEISKRSVQEKAVSNFSSEIAKVKKATEREAALENYSNAQQKKNTRKDMAGGKNKASGAAKTSLNEKRTDRGALPTSGYAEFEKVQAQNPVIGNLRNYAEGVFESGVIPTIVKGKTGVGMYDDLSARNPYAEELHTLPGAQAARTAGQITSAIGQGLMANQALGATKLGQLALAKNPELAKGVAYGTDAAIALAQNFGFNYGEGLKGKELVKESLKDTGIELAVGAALGGAVKRIGALSDAKKARKIGSLPTQKTPAEEVVGLPTKQAETVDLSTRNSLPDANKYRNTEKSIIDKQGERLKELSDKHDKYYRLATSKSNKQSTGRIAEIEKAKKAEYAKKAKEITAEFEKVANMNEDEFARYLIGEEPILERIDKKNRSTIAGHDGLNSPPATTREAHATSAFNAKIPQKDNSVKLKDLGADTNKTPPKYKQSQSIANQKGADYNYETTTHVKREAAAQQRLETDYEGEYKDLTTKQSYTDEDFATASKVLASEKEGSAKATRLLKKVAEQSSQKGQEFEAIKHLKDNTPTGKVYKAQQEAVRGRNKIKDKDPARVKKADGDIKKFTDIVNKSAENAGSKDEFVNNVKAEIDKLLKPKARSVEKVAIRNEIFKMIDNLKELEPDNVDELIDEIGNLISTKYGIPVVSSKQANEIIDYMKKAENAVSPRGRDILIARADQIIADIQKSTAKEKLKSLQRIFLLSNPKTLLSRNMGGNLLLASAETIKDLPATFFDQLVSLKTGQRTTTAFSGGKYTESAKGLGKGIADQFSDIKNRVDTSPSRGQYELPNKTIWDYKKSKTGVGRVFNKSMNFLDKVIGKSLQFGDRPFYEAAYKSRKAELEALVKKGKSTLSPEEINESARLFALDRTFQGDTKLAKWAGQLRDMLPFGNLIVPFTQTPANIIDKLLDYSPAGLARACMQLGNVKKGTFDQKRFVDALGRTFTGSGAIMLGYALYEKGLMTTDIYQEGGKDENNARTLAGEQSYSLKLGDTYISVDWADPIGSLLMIGADFGRGLGEKEELLSILTGGVTTAVDGVFDRSFLSGLTDLFDNISNEGVMSGVLETYISQIGSQVVPNIVKSANRIADPVKRETYDENLLKKQLNVIKSGVPGLSKTLPAKINVAGQEVKQYQGRETKDRALESLLAPYNKTVTNSHDVNDYLIDLYEKTGNGGVLLDQTQKSFSYEGTQYKLKNAEELSRMQKIQGQEAVKAVRELKKSEDFRKLSNADKAKEVTNALSDARRKSIEDYLIRSGEYTKTEIEFNKLSDSRQERYDSSKVSKDVYIDYFTTASTDDKSNITQAEARKKLDSMDLSEAQKQYLWSQTNAGWKAKY